MSRDTGIDLPETIISIAFPVYAANLGTCVHLSSGSYDTTLGHSAGSLLGIVYGTLTILILYALLPDDLRFSRVLILAGAASGC